MHRRRLLWAGLLCPLLLLSFLCGCGRVGFKSGDESPGTAGGTFDQTGGGVDACRDDNLIPGDGCDDHGFVEVGWSCSGAPSVCVSRCGDGTIASNEACDDGANGDECDGCLDDCTLHTNRCGDGLRCGGEQCDDGADGDFCNGCLPDCRLGPTSCECGSADEFVDAFDDGVFGDGWNPPVETGGTASELGGTIVLIPPAEEVGAGVLISTARDFDLTDSSVGIEVLSTLDPSLNGYTRFSIDPHVSKSFGLQQYGNFLRCSVYGDAEYCAVPFDPLAHRWWRLRGAGGFIYWDASADGVAWNNLAAEPTSADLSYCRVKLSVWILEVASSPGEGRFDNLNAFGGATGQGEMLSCLGSSRSDDFNDNQQGPFWANAYTTGGATKSEQDEQVVLTPPTNGLGKAVYQTRHSFDLHDNAVWVTVNQTTNAASGVATLFGVVHGANIVRTRKEATQIYWENVISGVPSVMAQAPYDSAAHRVWRIRESNGNVYWESSSDGISWVIETFAARPVDLSQVEVFLAAEATVSLADPGEAHFDNYTCPAE